MPYRQQWSRGYRSGLVVAMAQPVTFTCQLTITLLLARLLTPSDFGLVAMVTAITNFGMVFRDFGLGTVAVQNNDLSSQQMSNLFWANAVFGVGVALLLCVLAAPIAMIYGDQRVFALTLATAPVFALTGLSVQYAALLRRDLRFGSLVTIDVATLLISGTVATVCAAVTHSYWSLVLFNLSRPALHLAGVSLVSPWQPSRFSRGYGTLELLRRGLHIAAFDVVTYWARNLDNIVVGQVLGPVALGLYKKGYDLLLLPITQLRSPLTAVSLPILSRQRAHPEKAARIFLSLVSTLAVLATAVVTLMLLLSDWLIPLVLGEQWTPIIRVFQYLSPIIPLQAVVGLLGLLLITTDQSSRYLTWGLWHSSVMVASFVIGINWGLLAMIGCYVAANVLTFLPSVLFCTKGSPVRSRDFTERALVPILMCWATFGLSYLVKGQLRAAGFGAPAASALAAILQSALIFIHVALSARRYDLLFGVFGRGPYSTAVRATAQLPLSSPEPVRIDA